MGPDFGKNSAAGEILEALCAYYICIIKLRFLSSGYGSVFYVLDLYDKVAIWSRSYGNIFCVLDLYYRIE